MWICGAKLQSKDPFYRNKTVQLISVAGLMIASIKISIRKRVNLMIFAIQTSKENIEKSMAPMKPRMQIM